jgi:hypothetical protein
MPTKGYDVFFPRVGAYNRMVCKVCGSDCEVSCGRIGPTSSAEAILGAEQPHDRFICPHTDLPWHNTALALLREAEAEPDPLLRRFIHSSRRQLIQPNLGNAPEIP